MGIAMMEQRNKEIIQMITKNKEKVASSLHPSDVYVNKVLLGNSEEGEVLVVPYKGRYHKVRKGTFGVNISIFTVENFELTQVVGIVTMREFGISLPLIDVTEITRNKKKSNEKIPELIYV